MLTTPTEGGSNHNYNGLMLNRSINNTDLVFLTDFEPTRLSPSEEVQSVINLIIASSDFSSIIHIQTHDEPHSSDHFPIKIQYI